MQGYRGPRWLPGGHAQTIWPALFSPRPALAYRRERWDTPDGDFIDVDFLDPPRPDAPWLVLFHGLEGSSASHYAVAFAAEARARGWGYAVPHFRGCSGSDNRAPRAYHSGDFEEIGWILGRLRERTAAPLHAVGVSLGGNALLRWTQEAGDTAAAIVANVAAVSSPVDLAAAGHAIGQGFNRLSYQRMFLRSMKPKALAKVARYPGLAEAGRIAAARSLREFDDAYTAPVHGFAGVADYWARCSAAPHLARCRVPALVLNARNDPFVPAASLPSTGGAEVAEVGRFVTLWQPPHGGHVGFPAGAPPGHLQAMPAAVTDWLARHR